MNVLDAAIARTRRLSGGGPRARAACLRCGKPLAAVACLFVFTGTAQAELVDPTRPVHWMQAPPAIAVQLADHVWVLTGVKIGGSTRSALVNGRLIEEGGEVDGARLVRVKATSVVLDDGGQIITVPLLQQGVKTRVADAAQGAP